MMPDSNLVIYILVNIELMVILSDDQLNQNARMRSQTDNSVTAVHFSKNGHKASFFEAVFHVFARVSD